MKSAVRRIISVLTLVTLVAAIVGQALTYALGIVYDPNGQPVDPTPLNQAITYGGAVGGILSLPLTATTFILGLVVMAGERHFGWLAALVVAGVVAFVGLIAMAWVLLSVTSPIAFQTPLVTIPVVTLLSNFGPARPSANTPHVA